VLVSDRTNPVVRETFDPLKKIQWPASVGDEFEQTWQHLQSTAEGLQWVELALWFGTGRGHRAMIAAGALSVTAGGRGDVPCAPV
jgi:hypothetical protein